MILKLFSWNVNGIRAIQKKGFWSNINFLNPDILSVQEIKTDAEKMREVKEIFTNQNWRIESFSAKKAGYSGVANIFKNNPKIQFLKHEGGVLDEYFDVEGRLISTFFQIKDKKFALLNGYYPQGGRGEHRIQYKLEFYQKVLQIANKLKQDGFFILLCGDFNTTVGDIDLARPKENKNSTGALPIEREGLAEFFKAGFIDSFRFLHPEKTGAYSYWDQITRARNRNVGWRIDFFLIDERLLKNLKSAQIHPYIFGSDHAPVSVEIEIK